VGLAVHHFICRKTGPVAKEKFASVYKQNPDGFAGGGSGSMLTAADCSGWLLLKAGVGLGQFPKIRQQ
jgi:hypothetical protein